MARLQPARPSRLDPIRRVADAFSKREHGHALEPAAIIGHHRPLLAGYGALELALDRFSHTLAKRPKELAMLRAAQLVGCEWCLDFGSHLARKAGVPDEDLRELAHWRQSERFGDLDRLVLEYAETMTRTPVEVSDELFARLRAHLDERQLVELTMAIGLENLHARVTWALGIESQGFTDGAYCVAPDPCAAAAMSHSAGVGRPDAGDADKGRREADRPDAHRTVPGRPDVPAEGAKRASAPRTA